MVITTFLIEREVFELFAKNRPKTCIFNTKNLSFQSRITRKISIYRKNFIEHFLLKICPSIHFRGYFEFINFHPREGVASTLRVKAHIGAMSLLLLEPSPNYSPNFTSIGQGSKNSERKTFNDCTNMQKGGVANLDVIYSEHVKVGINSLKSL